MTHSLLNKNLPLLFQCLNDWLWVLFFFSLGWAYLMYQKPGRSVRIISLLPSGVQKTKVISFYDWKWKLLLPRPLLTIDKICSSGLRNTSFWCCYDDVFQSEPPLYYWVSRMLRELLEKTVLCSKSLGKNWKKLTDEQLASTLQDLSLFISNNTLARVFSNLFEQIKFFFHGAICETSFPKYTFWEILSSNDKKLRHDLNTASWLTSHEILSKSSNHARSKLPHLKNGNDYCFYFWYFAATRQFCYYYYYYPYY